MNILDEANMLIHGDRREQYGDASEEFTRVANIWSALLGVEISNEQVALCMTALKLVRATVRENPEDLVDGAGYLGLAGQCRGYEERGHVEREHAGFEIRGEPGVYRYCLTHGRYEKLDGSPAVDARHPEVRRSAQEDRVAEAGAEDGAPLASGGGKVFSAEPVGGKTDPEAPCHCGCPGSDRLPAHRMCHVSDCDVYLSQPLESPLR